MESKDAGADVYSHVDRYGFIAGDDDEGGSGDGGDAQSGSGDGSVAAESGDQRRERLLLENSRLEKWRVMLRDWGRFEAGGRRKVLRRRVRKGIPEAVRGRAWYLMSGAPRCKRETAGSAALYGELVGRWGALEVNIRRAVQEKKVADARADAANAAKWAAAQSGAVAAAGEDGAGEATKGGTGGAGEAGGAEDVEGGCGGGGGGASAKESGGGSGGAASGGLGGGGEGGGGESATLDAEAAAAALKLFDFDCIISADIGRTFPNHLLFKDKGGGGQASLRRVLRAHLGEY